MGSCMSKKGPATKQNLTNGPNFSPNPQPVEEVRIKKPTEVEVQREEEARPEKEKEKESSVKKHRKSHDRATQQQHKVPDGVGTVTVSSSHEDTDLEVVGKNVITSNANFIANGTDSTVCSTGAVVRTSSCTKEEVDAILIQCGRLSQVASGGSSAERSRKYSGSKRSFDFDHNDADDGCDNNGGEIRQHRERSRQSGPSPQGRRRRTPSREREQQSQRSNSKERSGSGSRRVSRSPGKRSGNSSCTASANVAAPSVSANSGGSNGRPGKMVSVPATVPSLGEPAVANTSVKRITVKRNVGEGGAAGSRSAASPRAQSPAGTRPSGTSENNPRVPSPARGIANGSNENARARSPARINANGSNENQQALLSRNSSRKAEHSPYRRNPLSEIDPNSLAYPLPTKAVAGQTHANSNSRVQIKSKECEADGQKPSVGQGANHKISSRGTLENKVMTVNCPAKEQQQHVLEEAKGQTQVTRNVVPQTLTRSRSSRRSQDLDLNPESLTNPNPSYTSLLLEDIQNFQQKSTLNPNSFSLPPCVTKANSIVEAVADLNCSTGSILSCTFSEERMRTPTDQFSRTEHSLPSATILAEKKRAQHKDPFVESEVIVNDDLMEPSLHKYVTVRSGRGAQLGGGELEEEESLGSNSFVGGGGQQHWGISSSSWELNSADSTDCWTSRSNTKENDQSSLESGHTMEEGRRGLSGKRRNFGHQQTGIGRGKVGGNRGPQAVAVAAAST